MEEITLSRIIIMVLLAGVIYADYRHDKRHGHTTEITLVRVVVSMLVMAVGGIIVFI